MEKINYKLLNGGYYALMIDGEEIGIVYKQEHALAIEIATTELPKLEATVNNLQNTCDELTVLNKHLQYGKD